MRTLFSVLAFAVMGLIFLNGCEKTSAQVTTGDAILVPPLNNVVIVTVRSDIGQLQTVSPTMPSTTGITPFGPQSVSGTLTAATENWVVVSTTVQDYWIPRQLVVMIQVPKT